MSEIITRYTLEVGEGHWSIRIRIFGDNQIDLMVLMYRIYHIIFLLGVILSCSSCMDDLDKSLPHTTVGTAQIIQVKGKSINQWTNFECKKNAYLVSLALSFWPY